MRKATRFTLVAACVSMIFSCSVKRGCPSNGKNIGAERLLNPDKQTAKDLKKVKKFKS
jgi:hypothetical protein